MPTVREYAATWIAQRRALQAVGRHRSVRDDDQRLRDHILPFVPDALVGIALGDLPVSEVRPAHVKALVHDLLAKKLAPRTVWNVYTLGRTMFVDIVADELRAASPWTVRRGTLPPRCDAKASWRGTAIFNRAEAWSLVTAPTVRADRRTMNGLLFLAGLRRSEAARLRLRDYDPTWRPLGVLHVLQTKTDVPRDVPVHPALAARLDAWLSGGGWEAFLGRKPEPGDLLVPTRQHHGEPRCIKHEQREFRRDMERLGLRVRRGHDARRTFISLSLADGARRDILRFVTHGARGRQAFDLYEQYAWADLCGEVAKLRFGDALPVAPAPGPAGESISLAQEAEPR